MNRMLINARQALAAIAALMAVACAAPHPKPVAAQPAPPALDASYDWHVLLIAPFGSALKDIPLALHEVLLFRDAAPPAAGAAPPPDEPECYAVEGKAPRFMARLPSEYLVCLKHDRLSRVEATVRLAQTESAQIFADACGLWTKNASPVGAPACEGTDGNIAFAAHLESEADAADAQLVIQLNSTETLADR